MDSPLFRPEAEVGSQSWLGPVCIASPRYLTVIAPLSALLLCALVAFMVFGTYTRNEHVKGRLVADNSNAQIVESGIADGRRNDQTHRRSLYATVQVADEVVSYLQPNEIISLRLGHNFGLEAKGRLVGFRPSESSAASVPDANSPHQEMLIEVELPPDNGMGRFVRFGMEIDVALPLEKHSILEWIFPPLRREGVQ